jgi:peroxiredoxin Q/BCP
MRSRYEEFVDAGAAIVAVSQDDAEDVNEYWREHDIPFVCIPDPEGRLKTLYNQHSRMGPLPAVFVIDRQGRLAMAHYGEDMKDIPTADRLLALLKTL